MFEETAKEVYNVMEIWRMARAKGLRISKSQIWKILRNPFCCGRLFIPAYKVEKAMVVKASHEPIITTELFDEVQDILNGGRKRKFPKRQTAKDYR